MVVVVVTLRGLDADISPWCVRVMDFSDFSGGVSRKGNGCSIRSTFYL